MKKKVMIIFGVLLVVGILGGALGGSDEPKKVDTPVAEVKPDVEVKPEAEEVVEADDNFYIGETIDYKGYKVTVVGVDKSAGSEYDKPKAGKEYVIVSVEIQNDSKEKQSYNLFDYSMQNSNGEIESISFTIVNTDTALSSGDLAPGGKTSGTLAFEQPIDDANLILNYKASFWSDKDVPIILTQRP